MLDLLSDYQNGFRKGRWCEDHAFTLSTVLRNKIQAKQYTFIAYIDFEKAFDWVDRNMLFYTLFNYNVDGKLCKAIEAMYNCTRCAINPFRSIMTGIHGSWICATYGLLWQVYPSYL